MPTQDLQTRTRELTGSLPEIAAPPERIGHFRILGVLGQGGMGVVYRAEQDDPQRQVALKMIRGAGLEQRQIAMFRREIEVLARLEHPNIASIFEAGVSEDGQHFYSMELVQGEPLDDFLSKRSSTLNREEIEFRIELFRRVCDAVHFAHQRGVIHRDLKPSNILVSETVSAQGVPDVKVLDFGLARITDDDIGATMMTEVGVVKGTLPYMSPEQASGDPSRIDTRSDVYALGVVLYEILSGVRPVQFGSRSLVEAVRVICEDVPKRLGQVWPGPGKPARDLETIVHKALEKNPDRRYSGADGLSQDLLRFRLSQPITAVPPSSAYLLRKFAQRNRVLVGGVVATVAALAVGVAVATSLAYKEAAQRRLAEAARDDLEAVVGFQSQILSRVDPERTGSRLIAAMRNQLIDRGSREGRPEEEIDSAVQDLERLSAGMNTTDLARNVLHENVLEPAARAMQSEFADRPLIEARLRHTIGDTYRGLGLYDRGEEHLGRSVDIRRNELGREHRQTLVAKAALGNIAFEQRDYDAAEKIYREVLADGEELPQRDPFLLKVSSDLAGTLWSRDRSEEGATLLLKTLEVQESLLGPGHVDTLRSKDTLAVVRWGQRQTAESEALWREVLDGRRAALGDQHVETLSVMGRLAGALWTSGELEPAAALYREALDTQRMVLGDGHPRALRTVSNLAAVYVALGNYDEAIRLHRGVLELRRRTMGPSHTKTLNSMNNLAVALTSAGQTDEAQDLLSELLALDEQSQPGSAEHALHLHTLAELHLSNDELTEAGRRLREALEIYERYSDRNRGLAYYQLATVEARTGRADEAITHLARASELGHRWTAGDEALASLADHPEFAALAEPR
ncbi:hypothetical protein ABI59_18635 [Acidobacteria bacterium Mor1]|nr:hypothetical protein ABI59_18635 [Acidobacteria bacterium Mor1]